MKSKKKGGCKLLALVVVLAFCGIVVMAAEPAINPAVVTTGRVAIYGATPLKIGSTEYTEAGLNAAVGGTVALANTKILIGSAGGVAAPQTVSGAITLAANGVATIAPTTTVTRLVASGTMTLDGRTPVVGYSTQPIVADFFPACTNGQVITYAGGAFGSLPAVTVSYAHTTGAFAPTTNCYVHTKTATGCVVVCEDGLKVDVIVLGGRNY